jgi:cell division protein ZapA (FtsZ GTPase activity inhibitor)
VKLTINGVVINYATINGLQEAVKAHVEKLDRRLEKLDKEQKHLRRQRRGLMTALNGRAPRKSASATPGT